MTETHGLDAAGLRWADESKALHWIDRYAAGIDEEPQMDRILACVAASPSAATPALPAAQVKGLTELLTDVRNKGLIYWEPNTDRGYVKRAEMLDKVDEAIAALSALSAPAMPDPTPPVAPAPTSDEVAVPDSVKATAELIADALGVTPHSDIRPYVIHAVEMAHKHLVAASPHAELATLRDETIKVVERFAARCEEAVRPDDADNDGVTVKTRYLRAARALLAKLKGRKG